MGSRSSDRSGEKADAIRKGIKIRRKRNRIKLAAFTHKKRSARKPDGGGV